MARKTRRAAPGYRDFGSAGGSRRWNSGSGRGRYWGAYGPPQQPARWALTATQLRIPAIAATPRMVISEETEMQARFPSPPCRPGCMRPVRPPSGPAATILICLVTASGAVFGIAAHISLQRLGRRSRTKTADQMLVVNGLS